MMGGREMLLGSIEAGGTKFVCSVGTPELEIIKRVSFPTTTPSETLALVIDFFNNMQRNCRRLESAHSVQLIFIRLRQRTAILPRHRSWPGRTLTL